MCLVSILYLQSPSYPGTLCHSHKQQRQKTVSTLNTLFSFILFDLFFFIILRINILCTMPLLQLWYVMFPDEFNNIDSHHCRIQQLRPFEKTLQR